MDKLLSVIVPVYNVSEYLDRCVESIINQTYRDIEIILVDDGSSDGCLKLCDQWARKDKRIVVVHKVNGGLSSARNAGLDIAQGAFVGFIDPDDYVDKEMYGRMMGYFADREVGIVECGVVEKFDAEEEHRIHFSHGIKDTDDAIKHLLTWDGQVRSFVWNKVYRKSVIDQLRFLDELRYGEDTPFVFRALLNCKKFIQVDRELYYYVHRNNSLTGMNFTPKRLLTITASERILEFCEANKLDKFVEYAICSVALNCYTVLRNLLRSRNRRGDFKKELRLIKSKMRQCKFSCVLKMCGRLRAFLWLIACRATPIYAFFYKMKNT